MIYYDTGLNQLVLEKCDNGCRDAIYKAADSRYSANSYKIFNLYLIAERAGHLAPGLVLTIVHSAPMTLFFNKSLEETRKLIENIKPKLKARVPNTVLTKMVALRMGKLKKAIETQNMYFQQDYNWQKKTYEDSIARGVVNPPAMPVLQSTKFPDNINTLAELHEAIAVLSAQRGWDVERCVKSFKKEVLVKPELTDEVVVSAMNLVRMGQVQEE